MISLSKAFSLIHDTNAAFSTSNNSAGYGSIYTHRANLKMKLGSLDSSEISIGTLQ